LARRQGWGKGKGPYKPGHVLSVRTSGSRGGITLGANKPLNLTVKKKTLHGCFVHCIEGSWYIFRTKKPTAGKLMMVAGIEKFPTRTYLERILDENGWYIDHTERIRAIKGRSQNH
jgi:hypothetical protein